ncbi:MAG TPA: peptide chain release factor N(5)-glutamine methyltransferase [Candidatus Cloacimonadota bacterium]|nr:peptide chain release factor N(5)-glutamine methyltransferase [Candidatus Cloacimonadota bacterium]
MKLINFTHNSIKHLNEANIENPKLNVELIISHVLGIKRTELYLEAERELTEKQLETIEKMLERRSRHEPLQYILGETEFYGFPIKVNPAVLIPRPETELLVERIIKENPAVKSILEIGTGSGCIAIALKKLLPDTTVMATDISAAALQTARQNAELNHTEIDFIQADLWEIVTGKFDLIVSNPPYIPPNEYDELPAEIIAHEPEKALLAEEEGMYFYRSILEKAKDYLNENGSIYFEIGYNEAERIRNIAVQNDFSEIDVFRDLNGFERIMRIKK